MNYLFFIMVVIVVCILSMLVLKIENKQEIARENMNGYIADSRKIVKVDNSLDEKNIVEINSFLGCGKELLGEPCFIKLNYKFDI